MRAIVEDHKDMHDLKKEVKDGNKHILEAIMQQTADVPKHVGGDVHIHIHLPAHQSESCEPHEGTKARFQNIIQDYVKIYSQNALDLQEEDELKLEYDPDVKIKLPSYEEAKLEHVRI